MIVRGNQRKRREIDEDEESFFGDQPEGRRPGVPVDDGDPLWTIYAINPGLPTRVKIEKLMVMWELEASEIASILQMGESEVQVEVDKIERDWMSLGQDLTDDELQKARGKMIKELLQHKSELEGLGPTQDTKVITMKIKITEQIAKLRGLDRDRKPAEEEDSANPVAAALAKMTPEQSRTLLDRLGRE